MRAADRGQEGLGPRRGQLLLRRRAVPEAQDPGGVGQPRQGDTRVQPEEARRRGLEPARGAQGDRHFVGRDRGDGPMRALSVDADLIVFISRFWQTTCTAIRAGEEGFVVDSPVYPDELEALPGILEQAGFPVSGLL